MSTLRLARYSAEAIRLVAALRAGEDCEWALKDQLLDDGFSELADRLAKQKKQTLDEIDRIWRTMDGRSIPMSQMGEQHLKNTICFVRRRHMVAALRSLLQEAVRRGVYDELEAKQLWKNFRTL